jgi:glycosyltransferase involved in cell wall biosynthesis
MSKPMKILHVVGAMNRAGTETMLMNIYRNIDREKIQFDFISYSQEEAHYDQEINDLGGRVIRLSNTISIKQIYDVIKKYGPYDAVHSHTLFHCGIANMAALFAGVKTRIAHAHTTSDKTDNYTRKSYVRIMRLFINAVSTNLLACSHAAGSYLFGQRNVTRKNYSFFPNVIDYSLFLKEPVTEVKNFKDKEGMENSMIIGHIGRFIDAKNHPFLLQILKSVIKREPTMKLLLVGDGDLRNQMEEAAKNESIYDNIRFVGIRNDIPVMMHSMDIFVFPSLYEGLGLVLLEAQASGVPCVVSEAIQPEADLKIGLITKLSLADGPEVWADKIIEQGNKKEHNINKIIDGFENSGYTLQAAIKKLIDYYTSNDGGAHEKYIDRLL